LHEKKEVVLMKRMVVVLGVAAVMAAVVALTAGTALAQEESLPDLTIDKTGPSTATPGEYVTYNIDVTNVGSGDAVLPSGAVLVRDDIRSRSGRFTAFGFGNVNTTEGVTGLPFGLHNEFVPGGTRTKQTINLLIPPWESSDAIISPGGALRGATISAATEASGGFIIDCATVDPDNIIVESDESNNTECVTTKIVP
jgi:uncharacterized repeat protein (TIGR01451 family)